MPSALWIAASSRKPSATLFGVGGATVTDMGGRDLITALGRTPSGSYVAAGTRFVNGAGDFTLAEYTPDGVLATCPKVFRCGTWPAGKAFVDLGGSEAGFALDWRSDGRVVVAGMVRA